MDGTYLKSGPEVNGWLARWLRRLDTVATLSRVHQQQPRTARRPTGDETPREEPT